MDCPATLTYDTGMTRHHRNTLASPRISPGLPPLPAGSGGHERQPAARTASFGSNSGGARGLLAEWKAVTEVLRVRKCTAAAAFRVSDGAHAAGHNAAPGGGAEPSG